jgi:hypothetical protein
VGRLCRVAAVAFALAYVAALVLMAVGTFGLFGSERGPLAGVFVVLLGLPWIRWVDLAPTPLHPWLAAAAPALNLLLIIAACRLGHAMRTTRRKV